MIEKYAVNIPLLLTLVAFLAYLSLRNKNYIDASAKDDSNATQYYAGIKEDVEACSTTRTDTAIAKEEQELCRCGRHVKSANYFCVESTYYDDSDSDTEEETKLTLSPPLARAPPPHTNSSKGKKVTFTHDTVFKTSRNVDPPKSSDPITISPTIPFPKHPELDEKVFEDLIPLPPPYFKPSLNPYPRRVEFIKEGSWDLISRIEAQGLPQVASKRPSPDLYTKRPESVAEESENLTSLAKAEAAAPVTPQKASTTPQSNLNPLPDPSCSKISKLEASLAAQEAKHAELEDENRQLRTTISTLQHEKETLQSSQLDVERKKLAALKVDHEKARKNISELEDELSMQRRFTTEAYAELEKLEKSHDDQGEFVQLREQLKAAKEGKQQLLNQLKDVEKDYEQKEATLVLQAKEYYAKLDEEMQQSLTKLQTELKDVRGELDTAKTQASKDLTAYNNVKNELSGVRADLEATRTQADKNLAAYNTSQTELSGVREELQNTTTRADKNLAAYNTSQTELSGVREELQNTTTRADKNLAAYNTSQTELSGVREELQNTTTRADKNLAAYNASQTELSGVREELQNTITRADKNLAAYNTSQTELSGVRADLESVTRERDSAQWDLQYQQEQDADMEPEHNEEQDAEEQDAEMEPSDEENKVEQAMAMVALVRLELENFEQKLDKKTKALKESKKEAKMNAKRLNDLAAERDDLVKDHEREVTLLRCEVQRLEKLVDAMPGLRQAPKVASVMDYTKATQKQLVREVRGFVQKCEDLKIECERNRREGKREGFEEGLKVGRRELAEQLVPFYLAIGTHMARDFSPADLWTEQTAEPDTMTAMTVKQTEYAELLDLQKVLSRLMRECGLPAVQKVRGKGHPRTETDEELFDLHIDRFLSKRPKVTQL